MGQLADAKAKIAQGAAEEKPAKVKLAMQQKELTASEARLKKKMYHALSFGHEKVGDKGREREDGFLRADFSSGK